MAKPERFIFAALHLLALSALAVAQPLFDLLGRYPEFLVAHGAGPGLLLLTTVLLALAVPAVLALLGRLLPGGPPRRVYQLLCVALLGSLFFVQLAKRAEVWLSGVGVLALGLALGALLAAAYHRWKPVRSALTLLAATALLFPLFFLFGSPARRLLEGPPESATAAAGSSRAPVVMVVFDELPLLSLLDGSGNIDAGRFPHFARLAGHSYWFEHATTVSEGTLISIPAILDGLYPTPGDARLPTFGDHPRSLFTLLGASHDLKVFEFITQLAPPESRPSEAFLPRLRLLVQDLSLVYAHLALPASFAAGLPPITDSWKGFGATDRPDWNTFQADWTERRRQFEQFVSTIEAGEKPGLYFLHSKLPHASWKYLPDGRVYALYEKPGVAGVRGPNPEGKDVNWWLDDPWLPLQAHQRHLLQVGFVDTLLGRLVQRLQEVGLYDDCLLVITADHGTAFLADDSRREITETNYPAILNVPLLIKAPGQTEPVVIDRNVQTIDVLPTVADLLGIELPWEVDGQSAVSEQWNEPKVKTAFADRGVRFEFPHEPEPMRRFLERRIGTLGQQEWGPVFRIGRQRLLGLAPDELPRSGTAGRVELAQSPFFSRVDPEAGFVPALISGRVLEVSEAGDEPLELAVAVNGRIQALSRTSRVWGGNREFAALVPPDSFRPGENRVEVFLIGDGGRLGLLGQDRHDFRLETEPLRLVSSRREQVRVEEGHVIGWVVGGLTKEGDRAYVGGWAADREHLEPVASVLVFHGGRLIASASPSLPRADAVEFLKSETVRASGFFVEFPLEALPSDLSEAAIRVVALSADGHAAELNYPRPGTGRWEFLHPPDRE